jgi:uncharacterized protein (TIGR02996 family)
MTEEQALLAAIRAAPEDDLPRLVFADWLDEHRQPERAEFIRTSIHHQRSENGWMLQPHIHHKQSHLFVVPNLNPMWYLFRRGFVAEVRCRLSEWCGGEWRANRDLRPGQFVTAADVTPIIGIGPAVVAAHPVQVVTITDREPHAANFPYWREAELTVELFAALRDFAYEVPGAKYYATRELALASLSSAAIRWAKSQPR